ncbi:peptidoglycan DD-metalloendopeptidase family protein [Usitatibacter palustris]|uniref:M23ase beta-sheet core domain-containing protein n=1 Tax=Usitatibacter palustris TaxID=2732487 RepID=A0A6M4HBH1_9PROT|nr:peptidoglycan DD-metalloendopeptidase family protein [Usitatibacter palustris]QJR16198.1 hypothetical protein DSM104440_03027 [Usitatibacter palustris]
MRRVVFSLLLLAAMAAARAEFVAVPMHEDRISEAERERIWSEIRASESQFVLPVAKATSRPAFAWPLRAARGYTGTGFDAIAAFVDHDSTVGTVRDFQCGTRSYDRTGYNHKGTDISIYPDSWGVMAAGQVEVIAAAPGTIIFREDGNPDRNCQINDAARWNAVYVRHDDGSVAWYGHMKSGSLTAKGVGSRVAVGEYLGTVGSSGASSGPHLHFEVYDSLARLVDPFQGQCNSLNTDSWWATQPAYRETRVNRVVTASAAPVLSSCGTNGTIDNPGSISEKTAFKPGDTVYLVGFVRDLLETVPVSGRLLRPDGTVARTWSGNTHPTTTAAYYYQPYPLPVDAAEGTWIVEVTAGSSTSRAPFMVTPTGAPIANYTDLWWNANESGWGVNINHQGDLIFATWFTYDTDGEGLWLSMPEARRAYDGAFNGTLYRTTGIPFQQIAGGPAMVDTPNAVGVGSFQFTGPDTGTFSYTVNGVSQRKNITRLPISTPTVCMATKGSRASLTNYQDLWWNPAERGWGVNITHQGQIIFATWFTYNAGGRGQWISASDVRRQPTGEYRGRLYRTHGVAFDRIAGAPAITGGAVDVGEVTFTFIDGENARMDYTLDGVTQSRTVTRYLAGTLLPLCR